MKQTDAPDNIIYFHPQNTALGKLINDPAIIAAIARARRKTW